MSLVRFHEPLPMLPYDAVKRSAGRVAVAFKLYRDLYLLRYPFASIVQAISEFADDAVSFFLTPFFF